ncbi:MAG: HlyD family efflux transporter periplasmic adaptor subunit [Deltaproteobacteria bacterium]|nr:HlyD family efflux transporter periplasmic adaptor subunit [Deltaproteobacteria bacterium]
MTRVFTLLLIGLLGASCTEDSEIAVGQLERDRIELVAEANEPIVEIAVREGDAVAAGALVVRLAPERLAALREAADERVASAEARAAEAERGPRAEQIAQARARYAGARDALATAEREAKRARELHAGGVASDELVDQRERVHALARAERDAAAAALAELLAGTRSEQVAQAHARRDEARASAREAALREQRLEVRAPRAGVVDALPYKVGERPPAGAVVAVLLADGAPYARVHVPAALRARVKPGTSARARVDGFETPFEARVRSVAQDASFTPFYALTQHDRGRLSYVAEIDLTDDAARDLPSGLPVEVEFAP